MDIREAFTVFLNTPDLTAAAGMTDNNRRQMKMKLANNDQTLRYDTMRGWLLKAGFTEKTTWREPSKKKSPPVETEGL